MSEEKAPYHTGGNWQPPDYSSRDFLLELSERDHDMAIGSASTIGALLAMIEQLADGRYSVKAVFNGQVIGSGNYRKQGNELVVVQESGTMIRVFSPPRVADLSGPRCAKCGQIIVGEPGSSPSYEGPLCGSCAWGEWLAEHE